MNRLFVITVGSLKVRGLISPGELPDVMLSFYSSAEQHGAVPRYLAGGLFQAEKDNIQVKLTIGQYHEAIPSKLLADVLEEVMDQTFK